MSDLVPGATPQTYAVRIEPEVSAWIEREHARQASRSGAEAADAWEGGLLSAFASLATYPQRCVVATEDALYPNGMLRLLVYPARRRGSSWRVLFTVQEGGDDPPAVFIRLIRQAAQEPLAAWPAEDD